MNKIDFKKSILYGKDHIKSKIYLLFMLISTCLANAQVQNYSFNQSAGAYAELSNPTILATPTAQTGEGSIDDQVYTLAEGTIPFPFSFNGAHYTGLNVYANGFISFGSITLNNTTPISSSIAYEGVIAPFATDLIALYNAGGLTGNIVYQVTGIAPNREFVVQWSHFTPYSNTGYVTSRYDFNFQVRLHENGTILFVYDSSFTGTPSSTNAKVGLRGASTNDYTNRFASGNASSNWNATIQGTGNSNGIATNYSNSLPASGLTFTYTPPSECIAPAAQPTNLELSNTGIIINGSFTAASPAADRYLILRTVQGQIHNPPVNGTTYSIGQNESLNAYVAYYGADTAFENNYNHGIRGNNTYNYSIYSVSSACTGGPLYFTTNPLTDNITNCPISLNGITNSNITTNAFQLNWPLGENGNALPMSRIIEVATDAQFNNMVPGSPFTLTADDLSLTVTGLSANTQYYYRGKNVTALCESSYSTTAHLYTTCLPVLDFNENFDGVTGNVLPNCWSKITVGVTSSAPTVNVTPTSDYVFSAPNGVTFYGNGADMTNFDNKAILVSPQLNNAGSGTHRLRFRAKKSTATGTHAIRVVALSSNTSDAVIEVVGTISTEQLSTTWQEFSVNFDNYTGTASYVGIQRIDGATYSYMAVDDVIWEAIPSCPELQSASSSNPTIDGATITWVDTMGTPANGYEYFVSTTNTLPEETETFETTTATSVSITGQPNGTHYVFVRRACAVDDKSPWRQTSFTTVPTTPAPWLEEFGSSTPTGWTITGWSLGTSAGYPGNPGMNLHKNMWNASTSTATFTTIAVGPLNSENYELSFDYRQGAYSSPYAPLSVWGSFTVEVSEDFGATWNQVGIVSNNEDNNQNTGSTLNYIKKTYSLSEYNGKYVMIRINANRTEGDIYLSYDNFEIKEQGYVDPFCLPTFEYNADGNMITQVIFNTIDQTSSFTSGTTPLYEDFTAVSTNVEQGSTHQISVKGPSSTFPSDVMVYIDFNQNGVFTDEGEGFYIGMLQDANPANALTVTSAITIPSDAVLGTTKMRVVKNTNVAAYSNPSAPNSINGPCDPNLRAGQVEDYSLNITAATPVLVESVVVSVENNATPQITTENGTLQLVATVNPTNANQNVTWSITSGETFASVNENGLVTAIANGTVTVRATSTEDETKFGEIDIPINVTSLTCETQAVFFYDFNDFTSFPEQCWAASDTNPTISLVGATDKMVQVYSGFNATTDIYLITPAVSTIDGNHYLEFYVNSVSSGLNIQIGTLSSQTDYSSFVSAGALITPQAGQNVQSILIPSQANHQYIAIKIIPNGIHKVLMLDNVEWKLANDSGTIENVTISVENNATPEITTENGTLQLVATVNPTNANQNVTWTITSGNTFASVNENGLVTAIANGTVTVRATSVADDTKFDDIEININDQTNVVVENVVVSVENNATPQITTENGTLQLVATVNPTNANQNVTWSITSGNTFASVNENGLVTAIANGTVTVRATSVADDTKFDDIEITIDIESVVEICEAVATFDENFDSFTTFPENCWTSNYDGYPSISITNGTTSNDKVVQLYSGFASEGPIYLIAPELIQIDATKALSFDITSISQPGSTIEIGTLTDANNMNTFVAIQSGFAPSVGNIVSETIPASQTAKYVAIKFNHNGGHKVLTLDNIKLVQSTSSASFQKDEVTIYPNPSKGIFNIESYLNISTIEVYNAIGQRIHTTSSNVVDIQSQASGIYLIKVYTTDNRSQTYKVIKE